MAAYLVLDLTVNDLRAFRPYVAALGAKSRKTRGTAAATATQAAEIVNRIDMRRLEEGYA